MTAEWNWRVESRTPWNRNPGGRAANTMLFCIRASQNGLHSQIKRSLWWPSHHSHQPKLWRYPVVQELLSHREGKVTFCTVPSVWCYHCNSDHPSQFVRSCQSINLDHLLNSRFPPFVAFKPSKPTNGCSDLFNCHGMHLTQQTRDGRSLMTSEKTEPTEWLASKHASMRQSLNGCSAHDVLRGRGEKESMPRICSTSTSTTASAKALMLEPRTCPSCTVRGVQEAPNLIPKFLRWVPERRPSETPESHFQPG